MNIKLLSVDCETTTFNKGNPYDYRNYLVCFAYNNTCHRPDKESLALLQKEIYDAGLIIGFNFKFDLHWLRNHGVDFSDKRIWDCQIAEYILSRQTIKYPSLTNALLKYKLAPKQDKVKAYWDQGFQTDQIPWEILSEYNIIDTQQTLALFKEQWKASNPQQRRLILLCGQDLKVLQEMEQNGLCVDLEACQINMYEKEKEIKELEADITKTIPNIPINFNSGDHISALLYGGTICEDVRRVVGVYKTGLKTGLPRVKIDIITHTLPGIVKPIKKSELKKEGAWSTAEPTLRQLKDKTGTVTKLLEIAKLNKIKEVYASFIEINSKYCWPPNKIYGTFNQVTTATGRLSSTKPNLQNMGEEMQKLVKTTY